MNLLLTGLVTPPRLTGIGYYLQGLCRGFTQLADPAVQITVLQASDRMIIGRSDAVPFKVETVDLPFDSPARRLREWGLHTRLARCGDYDAMLIPNLAPLPLRPKVPVVMTIGDLSEMHVARKYGWLRDSSRRALARSAARRASACLTFTSASAHDIRDKLAPHCPVTAVWLASRLPRSAAAPTSMSGRTSLVYIGKSLPHKNLPSLVRGFGLAAPSLPGVNLRLVGVDPSPALRAAMEAAGLDGARVQFLGYLPNDALLEELDRAYALVLPSLWEGFGLPLVEAMSRGVPTIAAGYGAMAELTAGVGRQIDPTSAKSIGEAMISLYDPEAWPAEAFHAWQRASAFSWRETAGKTLAAIRHVLR